MKEGKMIKFKKLIPTIIFNIACLSGNELHAEEKKFFAQLNIGYSHSLDSGGTFSGMKNMGNILFYGIELGTQVTNNLRLSLGVDYRPNYSNKYNYNTIAAQRFANNRTYTVYTNHDYDTKVKSFVGMINLYYDFFDKSIINPYVFVGVGVSRNEAKSTLTIATGDLVDNFSYGSANKYNFSYKLGLGAKYNISEDFALNLQYHYIDLGKYTTKSIYNQNIANTEVSGKLRSHELMFGVSYNF